MRVRMTIALIGVVLAGLCFLPRVAADLCDKGDFVCPLCKKQFQEWVYASRLQMGQRLDLRPVGSGPTEYPDPLPICPKCGCVLYKDKDYTEEEVKALRTIVESKEFKEIPADAPSYHRLAKVFEGLKRPPNQVGYIYLQTSWQVDGDQKKCRVYLEKSLEWYEKFLGTNPAKENDWRTAQFIRGELLRRLEKFDDARKHFAGLGGMEDFKKEPFSGMIAQELELIDKKNASPQEIKRDKK